MFQQKLANSLDLTKSADEREQMKGKEIEETEKRIKRQETEIRQKQTELEKSKQTLKRLVEENKQCAKLAAACREKHSAIEKQFGGGSVGQKRKRVPGDDGKAKAAKASKY